MESLEIKLSDDTLQSLARLISGVVAQLQDSPRPMTPSERAVHANYAGQKPPTEFGLLVGTREAAKLLNVSGRTLWRMYNSGEMPKPIRIGRAIRWGYAELQAWVDSKCPAMDRWKYDPKP